MFHFRKTDHELKNAGGTALFHNGVQKVLPSRRANKR